MRISVIARDSIRTSVVAPKASLRSLRNGPRAYIATGHRRRGHGDRSSQWMVAVRRERALDAAAAVVVLRRAAAPALEKIAGHDRGPVCALPSAPVDLSPRTIRLVYSRMRSRSSGGRGRNREPVPVADGSGSDGVGPEGARILVADLSPVHQHLSSLANICECKDCSE